jgi:DNA-binding IclR family transcriptional regulator
MVSNPSASVRELSEMVGLPRSTCHERIVEIKVRLGRYIRFSHPPRRSKAA